MTHTTQWPGTVEETKFAEFLVREAGGHFVTLLRKGCEPALGVCIPGQTVDVARFLEAALSTDAEPVAEIIAQRDALIAAGLKCCDGTPNPNLRPFDLAMSFIDSTNTARKAADMLWQKYKTELDTLRAAPAAPSVAVKALGRFGHHPEPAIDFCIEVEALEGHLFDARHGIGKPGHEPRKIDDDFLHRVSRAMEFIVGGDQIAIAAKETLRALSAQAQDVAEPPKEIATWEDQQAFEAWALSERYEMHQHPLHYLFVNPETNAARQGWKAALKFVRDRFRAAPPAAKQEGKP